MGDAKDPFDGQICPDCGLRLAKLTSLKMHRDKSCDGKMREYNEHNQVLCLVGCQEWLDSGHRLRHEKICSGLRIKRDAEGRFKCPKCDRSLSCKSIRDAQKHARNCKTVKKQQALQLFTSDPRLEYKTYLEFCLSNGLDHEGNSGAMSLKVQAYIFEQMSRDDGLSYDIKVEEVDDDFDAGREDIEDEEAQDLSDRKDLEHNDKTEILNKPVYMVGKGNQRIPAREYNERKMEHYGQTEYMQREQLCTGTHWKHGIFPCPDSARLSLDTALLEEMRNSLGVRRDKGELLLELKISCHNCTKDEQRLGSWRRQSKIREDGVPLCLVASCDEPRALTTKWCSSHRLIMRAREWRSKVRSDRWENRLNLSTRSNLDELGSGISTSLEMTQFLAQRKAKLPIEWRGLKKFLDGPRNKENSPFFYVDTEYDMTQNILFEIAVYAANGELLLDTTIDHGITLKGLMKKTDLKGYVASIYGITPALIDTKTKGITISQLTKKLRDIGITRTSTMIEWSSSRFDFYAVTKCLEDNEKGSSTFLPARDRWLRGLTQLWKPLIPGCPSYALDLLFAKVFPDLKVGAHHRARVDTEKLMLMVEKAMEIFE